MKVKLLIALIIIFPLFLGACGTSPTPAPTPASGAPTPIAVDNTVSASGVVVPATWQNLSFTAGGQDLDLKTAVGDNVVADDLLATVDPRSARVAIDAAKAQLANARATLARLQDMEEAPDADLDAAKAAVTAARSALTQANSALGRTNMYAPFSGTVIDMFARDGDVVAPAVPLLLLADLTTLQVQTTDLSEVDAVRVSIGDTARVSFDALPDATIVGRVTHIALKNSPGAGVYYTVTIKLESIPDNLRWGMSAFVVITVK